MNDTMSIFKRCHTSWVGSKNELEEFDTLDRRIAEIERGQSK